MALHTEGKFEDAVCEHVAAVHPTPLISTAALGKISVRKTAPQETT